MNGEDALNARPPAFFAVTVDPRGGYHFLQAIALCVPAVLNDLYATVYKPLARTLPAKQNTRLYSFLSDPSHPHPLADRFRDPVDRWADRWFLLGRPERRRGVTPPPFHDYLHGVARDTVLNWHWKRTKRGEWMAGDPTGPWFFHTSETPPTSSRP